MATTITFRVFKNEKFRGNIEWDESDVVTLGRQLTRDETCYQLSKTDQNLHRIPFARNQDATYSRNHLEISRTPDARIKITNIGNSSMTVLVNPQTILKTSQSTERMLPATISIGEFSIRIERSLNTLSRQTRFHKDFESIAADQPSGFAGSAIEVDIPGSQEVVTQLIDQLSAANSILQQATTRDELYSKAIVAARKLIDMDGVAIVNADNPDDVFCLEPTEPSQSAVDEVCSTKQVRWSPADQQLDSSESQAGLECFIAAPIVMPREKEDRVVAVLYAHRTDEDQDTTRKERQPLSALLAQVFELIACSVAAGLVRIENQQTQSRFEQFFTPKLARKLMLSDTILEPCEKEVTILFCDIRRFSSISEKLGPTETSRWIQDVMTLLSECVHEFEGVVVDYIGDELMAMWGAPDDLPDHATQACECANRMIELLPEIDEKWRDVIGDETRFGIGIDSGPANVGNTGSSMRFKYGPLGDTVNRASRVQGLTKYLKVNAILTGATKSALSHGFQMRRLGKAKVVNIKKTIELFELCPDTTMETSEFANLYERALKDLEQGNLGPAAEVLKSLDFETPDHPALLMLNEIIKRVINEQPAGGFEWEFYNK